LAASTTAIIHVPLQALAHVLELDIASSTAEAAEPRSVELWLGIIILEFESCVVVSVRLIITITVTATVAIAIAYKIDQVPRSTETTAEAVAITSF
jgi:hypothetical protein